MTNALTTRDDFEYWLASMDDRVESFLASLPPESGQRLDFSPDSLDVLERLVLDKYPDTRTMLSPTESRFVDGAASYLGEVFRKTIGGKWDIRFDDPKFAFYGLPILVGGTSQKTVLCPLTMATASADRRTGTYLRTILENNRPMSS